MSGVVKGDVVGELVIEETVEVVSELTPRVVIPGVLKELSVFTPESSLWSNILSDTKEWFGASMPLDSCSPMWLWRLIWFSGIEGKLSGNCSDTVGTSFSTCTVSL
jgi:hypothetical protein